MIQSQTNDLSGQYKQIPPFAEWPNLTYSACLLPDAFVIDFRFDTAPYFTEAGTEGPPIDTERAVTDLYRYSDAEDALSHARYLLLAVPDVAAWDSAHHILSFVRAVLDAFNAMLNDGSRPEPVIKSISLPSAALSSKLKGLRPLALYLWDRPWRPDPFGSMPTRGNSGLEFPFGVIPNAEFEAWVTTFENKTPYVKIGCSVNNGRKTLWLVPFRTVEGGCSLSSSAFFGLRPLSAALQSRPDVPVRQYMSGHSLWSHDTVIGKRSVKDVDLNALAGSFVEALDRHPSDAVTAARQAVASQRARQELATLFTDTGHEDLLAQAQWWLQEWLEEKSGRANTLVAVLVAELSGVEAPVGVGLLAEAIPVDTRQMLAMSQIFLNFRENKTWFISACSTDTADHAKHKALPLECGLRVIGAANPFYGEGDIRLYYPVTLPTANGPLLKASVPILLQTLPMPAVILQQQALASEGAAADATAKLLESRLWDYRIAYDRQSAVQDTLIVRLDTGNTGASVMNATSRPDLFDALIEFSEAYAQLRTDLEQEDVVPQARESFEWLALNVSNAWMYRTQMMRMKQQVSYRIAEAEGEDGTLRVAITGAEGSGVPQLLPRYEGYAAERTGEYWRFRSDATQRYLPFADRNWYLRSLVFEKLDVLGVESARAELALERNLMPVDGKTPNPDFALRTGFVGPGAAAAPFLAAPDPIDISDFGQTLTERIEVFFTRLLGDTTGRWLRLTVSYSYEAIAGAGIPVTVPVLLLPKEAYATGLAARVATAIDEWKQRHMPNEPQSGAVFELDLTVFGMLEQRGVLRVRGSMHDLPTTQYV
ncbi:hypothetical protein [Mucilaginibacter aquariorum]|uniref:Baseplate protein J-like domain-containing protein n=1 Tax=Mucilaginibacter aquariorum TaxID=2967225 RepID=A0ABT1SVX3_9SPHI|nr:hypothetical protein [Mucilaginibacter aquariorum]MCQ6956505.1 hypothetical protein [Mucilaginibacter aquariorum]